MSLRVNQIYTCISPSDDVVFNCCLPLSFCNASIKAPSRASIHALPLAQNMCSLSILFPSSLLHSSSLKTLFSSFSSRVLVSFSSHASCLSICFPICKSMNSFIVDFQPLQPLSLVLKSLFSKEELSNFEEFERTVRLSQSF